jgi:hypothetical protein
MNYRLPTAAASPDFEEFAILAETAFISIYEGKKNFATPPF